MPDPDQTAEAPTAALCAYRDYRYTVVVSPNGLMPATVEAELWYQIPGAGGRRPWQYFARRTAIVTAKARGTVEAAFKSWVDGQAPADPHLPDSCRWCGATLTRDDPEGQCEACRLAHERYRRG